MAPWKRPNASRCNQALTPEKARDIALTLLTRRDHSLWELRHKLTQRGFMSPMVETVLEQLVVEGLINEARYAEIYASSRADKGYGPLRIQQELRERRIDEEIISSTLSKLDDFWMSNLANLHRKRWSSTKLESAGDEVRRIRFLRQRGFTLEQIKQLFRTL
jgi:regulatory protein